MRQLRDRKVPRALAPSPRTRNDSGVNSMLIFPSLLVQVRLRVALRDVRARGGWAIPKCLLPSNDLPALDPNPTLSRSPPLCCGQELFIKDYTGEPSRFFVDRLGKGLGSG